MSNLFDGNSDSESEFKCDNEYAKNYNQWRKKEVLNKLRSKYGEEFDGENSNESSSSEEDEEGVEITEQLEKDFFNTLASLKKRDPKIYDDNFKFFNEKNAPTTTKKGKSKEKPMYIMDYERKMLLENGGELSDSDKEEEDNPRARSPTYVEEQRQLKENLKKVLKDSDEEDDDNEFGGLLKARVKTKEEQEKEESDYKQWLLGQKENLEDETVEKDLKPLKDYWNDPKLDAGEKFLRDYILNKKFLDKEDENYIPTYEEIVHDSDEDLSEDEKHVKNQEEFEHKYNYRFEEPDQEFLKRYPRTVENSLRKSDDSRKVKRLEVKERKQKEKAQKMEEIQKLKELKKQEIEEKIKKLREITGNTEVAFEDRDLDDDFDPEEHDRRMQALFNDEFYQGEEPDQKPEFPELDEELEIERWDRYDPEENPENGGHQVPHCEDEDFNMDCEYDPKNTQQELIENSKGKKKRKRKSKFAKAISEPKPTFDPNDKSYEEYLDEYYKLDCEDIIGDIPCRFKYRKVVPNSFGLTIDEILRANDRELNRWASLKKATQHRPDAMEIYEQIAYAKKAQNEALKRKLLPSLYIDENAPSTSGSKSDTNSNEPKTGKNNKKKQNAQNNQTSEDTNSKGKNNKKKQNNQTSEDTNSDELSKGKNNEKKQNAQNNQTSEDTNSNELCKGKNNKKTQNNQTSEDTLSNELGKGKNNKKKQNAQNNETSDDKTNEENDTVDNTDTVTKKNKKKRNKLAKNNSESNESKNNENTTKNYVNNENLTKNYVNNRIENNKNETNNDVNNKIKNSTKNNENPTKTDANNANPNKNEVNNKMENEANENPTKNSTEKNKPTEQVKQRRKRNKKRKAGDTSMEGNSSIKIKTDDTNKLSKTKAGGNKSRNKFKKNNSKVTEFSDARLQAFGIKPKKFKNKLKYGNKK